jgi:hypothetical protein
VTAGGPVPGRSYVEHRDLIEHALNTLAATPTLEADGATAQRAGAQQRRRV